MSPEEAKAEWVKRLRSGEIPQGFGKLAAGEHRCCLGVLCDIAVEEDVLSKFGETYYAKNLDERSDMVQPVQVDMWFGQNANRVLPFVDREDGQGLNLSTLNDAGLKFDQIADIIERFL